MFSPTSLPKTITVGVDAVATPSGWRWATPVDAVLGHAYLYTYLFHVEPKSIFFSWTSPHPANSNEDRRLGLWLLRGATGATDHVLGFREIRILCEDFVNICSLYDGFVNICIIYYLFGFREHLHSSRRFREHLLDLLWFREHLYYPACEDVQSRGFYKL